jgi:hypothetical protein
MNLGPAAGLAPAAGRLPSGAHGAPQPLAADGAAPCANYSPT